MLKPKFLRRAREVHGKKYDYSLVPDKISKKDKVPIICPNHAVFFTTVYQHLYAKSQCPNCRLQKSRMTKEAFLKKCVDIHGDKFDLSKINYLNKRTKIEVSCCKHGSFFVMPDHFTRKTNPRGCPKCNQSKSEEKIAKILEGRGIQFVREAKFTNCRGVRGDLRFDFWIPTMNLLIEYDGEHHFLPIFSKQRLQISRKYDKIKDKYCKKHGILLLRISYREKLEEKLTVYLNSQL